MHHKEALTKRLVLLAVLVALQAEVWPASLGEGLLIREPLFRIYKRGTIGFWKRQSDEAFCESITGIPALTWGATAQKKEECLGHIRTRFLDLYEGPRGMAYLGALVWILWDVILLFLRPERALREEVIYEALHALIKDRERPSYRSISPLRLRSSPGQRLSPMTEVSLNSFRVRTPSSFRG